MCTFVNRQTHPHVLHELEILRNYVETEVVDVKSSKSCAEIETHFKEGNNLV